VGNRGEASVADVVGQSPPEAEAVCRHYLHIFTAEAAKIFAQFTSWYLTSIFHSRG